MIPIKGYYDGLPKRTVLSLDDNSSFKIKGKDTKITVKSLVGFSEPNKTLAKMKDSGNDLTFEFPTWACGLYPDREVTLDYAEAHYIYHILKFIVENGKLTGKEEITDKQPKE